MKQKKEPLLYLKGKTLAIVDWANVFGWTHRLKWEVNPKKLFDFLKSYPEIFDIRFYFGVEIGNAKSEGFQKEITDIGFSLISKEVKWVPLSFDPGNWKDKDGNVMKSSEIRNSNGHRLFQETTNLLNEFRSLIKEASWFRRKCDFDVEITKDALTNIDSFNALILFSGDGDYKALTEYLLNQKKKVIIVHPFGARGKEYNELLERETNKPYFFVANKLRAFLE